MADDRPLVSVVIPSHDAAPFLAEAVGSVRDHAVLPFEVLVVENHSSDDTLRVAEGLARADPRVRVSISSARGASHARAIGVEQARGDWVYFLDADDRTLPGAIPRLAAALRAFPEAVVAYGHHEMVTASGRRRGRALFKRYPSGDVLPDLLEDCFVFMGTALIRRRALGVVEMRSDLRVGEDWLLFAQLAGLGPFRYVGDGPVLAYRVGHASAMQQLGVDEEVVLAQLDAVYSLPCVTSRFSPEASSSLRRRRAARLYVTVLGTRALVRREWALARRFLRKALSLDPRALDAWILWACAQCERLPRPLAARLGGDATGSAGRAAEG